MSMLLSRMVAFAIAVVLLGTAATASARPKKHSPERTSTAITMCDGTPIIMQGIECKKRPAGGGEPANNTTEPSRNTFRGRGRLFVLPPLNPPSPAPSLNSHGFLIPPPLKKPRVQLHLI